MEDIAAEHARLMQDWGDCMAQFESQNSEIPRAEKEAACPPKPTPPGHVKNQHAGHEDWHKFHGGDHDRGKAQGNRPGAR